MKFPRWLRCTFVPGLMLAVSARGLSSIDSASQPVVDQLIPWLLAADDVDVPFAEVIHAVSGKRIATIDPTSEADSQWLDRLSLALDRVLALMQDPKHPVHQVSRINEASAHPAIPVGPR